MSNTTWYQGKVKYQKQDEQGVFKKVTETHLFCAMSYTDAETRVYDELGSTIRGEFSVVGLVPFPVVDIFDVEDADNWYACMVSVQDPSLDSDKIKMIKAKYLVKSKSVSEACDNLSESLKGLLTDHTILSVTLSPIIDVFPYREEIDKEISRDSEAYVLAVDGSPAVQGKTYSEGELILKSEYEKVLPNGRTKIITEEDLEMNPEFAENGLKVGDEIEIPIDEEVEVESEIEEEN